MDRYSYGDCIGKLVGKTTSGDFILENEETGEVTTHTRKDVKKVMPYTVRVSSPYSSAQGYIVEVKEGSVKEGDLVTILSCNTVPYNGVVLEVNTKKAPNIKDCHVYRIPAERCHP